MRLFVLALVLIASPYVTLGCSCIEVDFNTSFYQFNALYFRGKVIKDITPRQSKPVVRGNEPEPATFMPLEFVDKQYIVSVGRVFKGCSIKFGDRLLVTSGAHSCGMTLSVTGDYVMSSGDAQPISSVILATLGNRTKMAMTVDVGGCGYNRIWSTVPDDERAILRKNKKICV